MDENGLSQSSGASIEDVLQLELEQADAVLGTIGPVLTHLLINHDQSLFSDELLARVRGMVVHIARQLLFAQAEATANSDPFAFAADHSDDLAQRLMAHSPLLTHCHALALEAQVTLRLEEQNALDPVLSPLLEALIASDDEDITVNAMAALTAQARFMQHQQRMELPLAELPGDLFHMAILTWQNFAGDGASDVIEAAEAQLRREFDESTGRLGLFARMISALGKGAMAALSVSHAGVGLFLSALAIASNQDRDVAATSTNEQQSARLLLALRASGLQGDAVEGAALDLHRDLAIPDGFDALRAERAAALLALHGRPLAG